MSDSDGASGSSSSSEAPATNKSLHAQAVRFLTSLRHHSPDASTEAQRKFLKSKGLDEDAIAIAIKDAERSQGTGMKESASIGLTAASEITDEAAFDLAKQAFDDPISAPWPPALPARSYPRSPLALYYQNAQNRTSAAALGQGGPASELALSLRYVILLSFFRRLTYFTTLGGVLTTAAAILYRAYVMPKWKTTLDCRSFLLKHHHFLWDNVVGAVADLKDASLAPRDKVKRIVKPEKSPEAEADDDDSTSNAARRIGTKRVHFADEVDGGGNLEQREGEEDAAQPKKTTQMGKQGADEKLPTRTPPDQTDEWVTLSAKSKESEEVNGGGDGSEGAEKAARRVRLEPIDLCEPIWSSLAKLNLLLRDSVVGSSVKRSSSSLASLATTASEDVSDLEEDDDDGQGSSGSDSWQDDDGDKADDVEFDPFIEFNDKSSFSKTSKFSSKARRKSRSGNPLGNRKHSPSSLGSSFAPPVTASAFAQQTLTSSASSAKLYTSLADFNATIRARSLAAQTSHSFRLGAGAAYGSLTFGGGGGAPFSTTATKSGDAGTTTSSNPTLSEEERTKEIAAQIRAEIRSFKGLLLSRRNFPRHGHGFVAAHGVSDAINTTAI